MASAALLRSIRARVHLRHVRARARTLAPIVPPSPVGYATELLALSRRCAMIIRSVLLPVLERAQPVRLDSHEDEIKDAFARLRVALEGTARDAPQAAKVWAGRAARVNQDAMNRQFRAVLPIDAFHETPAITDRMAAAAARNVQLIRSIPERLLDDVKAEVLPRVQAGVRVEETAAALEARFAISERYAARIARTETNKLNAELTQTRHEELGIGSYTWHTAGDERVRGNPFGKYPKSTDNHFRLQGKVCTYAEPPVVDETTGRTANPGEDFECRCQALPNVSDLLSSLEAEDRGAAGVDFAPAPAPAPVEPVVPPPVVPVEPPALSLEERLRAYDMARAAEGATPPTRLSFAERQRAYEATRSTFPTLAPATPAAVERIAGSAPTPVKRSEIAGTLGPLSREVFGKRLTDVELDNLLGLDRILPDGITAEITTIREEDAAVRVHATFKQNGQFAGNLVREFSKNEAGETVVHHALFALEKHLQRSKLGAKIFNAQIEAYKRTGLVQKVELEAAWVGQYAWTKAGFEWADSGQISKLMNDLRARLLTKLPTAEVEELMAGIETPLDVAHLSVGGERVGKDLLVNYSEDLIPMAQTPAKIKAL